MSKPLFSVDRVCWNRSWEDYLAKIYGSQDIPSYTGPNTVDRQKASWDTSDSFVHYLNAKIEEVCILQRELSREASRRFAEDDFESRWKSCTSETREEWILEGLVRTCEPSPFLESCRTDCPEVTLSRLNKGNGQPFLDLMQALCLEDTTKVPEKPKALPSDSFDHVNGHKIMVQNRGRQLFQLMELTKRTYFLVLFVFSVLLAFHGQSITFQRVKTSDLPQNKAEAIETAKAMGVNRETYKSISANVRAAHQGAKHVCKNCKLPASSIEGLTTLVVCTKCKSIGRCVYYCGRSCQLNDYKNGNPPHKQICGNKNALAEATLSSFGPETAISNAQLTL